jgi:hypothetical protein
MYDAGLTLTRLGQGHSHTPAPKATGNQNGKSQKSCYSDDRLHETHSELTRQNLVLNESHKRYIVDRLIGQILES